MKKTALSVMILFLAIVFTLPACQTGEDEAPAPLLFPAYEEENPHQLPIVDTINRTPKFEAHVDFPESWTVKDAGPGVAATVPGDFYTPLYLYEGDRLIGYIGFNVFEPYTEEIPREDYYKTVYPSLRLSSVFCWDPYTAIRTAETAETGIADIRYLDPAEIDRHPGAMAGVPQLQTVGILSYDKKLGVFIGIAFLPDTVERAQAEAIAQSVRLSPAEAE